MNGKSPITPADAVSELAHHISGAVAAGFNGLEKRVTPMDGSSAKSYCLNIAAEVKDGIAPVASVTETCLCIMASAAIVEWPHLAEGIAYAVEALHREASCE